MSARGWVRLGFIACVLLLVPGTVVLSIVMIWTDVLEGRARDVVNTWFAVGALTMFLWLVDDVLPSGGDRDGP